MKKLLRCRNGSKLVRKVVSKVRWSYKTRLNQKGLLWNIFNRFGGHKDFSRENFSHFLNWCKCKNPWSFKKTQVRKMKTKKMDEKRSQSHLERITKINVKINSCATKVSLMEQKSAKFWIKIYSPIKMMKIAIFKYWYS